MSTASEEQRAAITKAALDLLADGGPQALRVREIASAASCTTMTVYSRFGGKLGLIQEVYVESFRSFTRALKAPGDSPPESTHDHVVRLCEIYRVWALENQASYALMFTEAVPGFKPSDDAWAVALEAFQLLADGVAALQSEGAIRAGDPVEIGWAIWGVLHGLVMLEMADVRPVETIAHSTAFETGLAAIIRGFAP